MQHAQGSVEAIPESSNELRSETYLRNEYEGSGTAAQRLFHEPQVHLSLAAARGAVQDERAEASQRSGDGFDSRCLLG